MKIPAPLSQLEETLALHIRAAILPEPVREHRFAPPRRWRFDFAWPDALVAAEVEGGTRSGGRHVRGSGYEADCEKYNTAAIDGWCVLRFSSQMVADGRAIAVIGVALDERTNT